MKKVFLFVFLLSSLTTIGQGLIRMGERVPNYYYCYPDSLWWDYYANKTYKEPRTGSMSRAMFECEPAYENGQMEMARPCYSPRPLKIIGIAGAVNFYSLTYSLTTDWEDREPEYFTLYEVTTSDSLIPLTTVRWDTATPRFYMYTNQIGKQGDQYRYSKVYEAYFDEPIEVTDSFYVSGTMFNNSLFLDFDSVTNEYKGAWRKHRLIMYAFSSMGYFTNYVNFGQPEVGVFRPPQDYFKYRFHEMDQIFLYEEGEPSCSMWLDAQDTNWHTVSTAHFLHIFPIYDTSNGFRYNIFDTCPSPTGFSIVDADEDNVALRWDGNDSVVRWELELTQDDDSSTAVIYSCTDDTITVSDLNNFTWYSARLRSICDSGDFDCIESPWSQPLSFYVYKDTASHEGIADVPGDRTVVVQPNPATDAVTVSASSTILSVEFYNLQGVLVLEEHANAASTRINTSRLPAAVYTLRIKTDKGTATRKLTVR